MKKSHVFQICLVTCSSFLLMTPDTSHAGAALYRVQQMKGKKQQQEQQAYQQQYQMQQDAQEQQQAVVTQTYQQKIEQRNQALAQAIVNAHSSEANGSAHPPASDFPYSQDAAIEPSASPSVQEVVDLAEVWKRLDKKSTVWKLLGDDQAKLLTVSEYLDRFRKQGVNITQPPGHYAQRLNEVTQENPPMLQMPFGELLQILAIIDYDFDNGIDKDLLARKVLGQEGYASNKKRLEQQLNGAAQNKGLR
jgi:hypothetical protein